MVRVYVASVLPLMEEQEFQAKLSEVSDGRRRKVLACSGQMDRCRSLACGLLFAEGCRREGWSTEVYEGRYGKPMLRSPEPDEDRKEAAGAMHPDGRIPGRYFNLSHAGDYAAAVFSDHPVGIDIECCGRFADKSSLRERQTSAEEKRAGVGEGEVHTGKGQARMLRIARRILSEQEAQIWKQTPDDKKESELVRIWTRKEAYAKMDGRGLAMDFKTIDTLREDIYQTQQIAPGYWISVCGSMQDDAVFSWQE